jgi:membrane associated rhomboid family serine protease
MGIWDREYLFKEPGLGEKPVVTITLIAITCVLFFFHAIIASTSRIEPISEYLSLLPQKAIDGLEIWRFFTYGFVHRFGDIFIVLINMLMLYIFGKEIEILLGRTRYILLYILAIVFSGVICCAYAYFIGKPAIPFYGSYAPVMAAIVFFTLNFPKQAILFFFIIPMKVWMATVIILAIQVLYCMVYLTTGLAPVLPIAGAFFAYLFFKFEPVIGQIIWHMQRRPLKPTRKADEDLAKIRIEVDMILEKISREGMGSLTKKERKILAKASQLFSRYKK